MAKRSKSGAHIHKCSYMIEPELDDALEKQDWDDIILRLTNYVCHRLRMRNNPDADLPLGFQAKDIAFEAIKKVFNRERAWDPVEQPELLIHLISISNSIISKLLKKESNVVSISSVNVGSEDESQIEVGETFNFLDAFYAKETLILMLQSLESDPDATLVFKMLQKGKKPQQIASELGKDIADVRNIVKRIKRKVKFTIENRPLTKANYEKKQL